MSATAMYWLWHAAASVGVAAAVTAAAVLLHRSLRLSHAARGYWIGAWMLAALPAPLAIGAGLLVPSALPSALPVLVPLHEWSGAIAVPGAAAAAAPAPPYGAVLLVLYAAGIAVGAVRWANGVRALRRILRMARPFDAGALRTVLAGECAQLRACGIRVLAIEHAITPFAVCWPQRTIVLPVALLARLDDRQLRLVLRHEAAHLARLDPLWAALIRAVGLLLWFNPLLRILARRVQWATELACDAAALAADASAVRPVRSMAATDTSPRCGDEKNMRRAFAQAYLETLRMSMARALPCPATAFSPHDPGSHRMRIQYIVHGDPNARKRPLLAVALAAAALTAGGGLTVVQASTGAAPAAIVFTGPIIEGRISSPYGAVRANLSARPHNGIDLTAARGTPVHAPAAGTVRVATEHYEPAPNYGTVIVLDHGQGWQTVYAHLDRLDVAVGDAVDSGEAIGTLGISGKATGPHVHVEVLHDGVRVDPASVIGMPVAAK